MCLDLVQGAQISWITSTSRAGAKIDCALSYYIILKYRSINIIDLDLQSVPILYYKDVDSGPEVSPSLWAGKTWGLTYGYPYFAGTFNGLCFSSEWGQIATKKAQGVSLESSWENASGFEHFVMVWRRFGGSTFSKNCTFGFGLVRPKTRMLPKLRSQCPCFGPKSEVSTKDTKHPCRWGLTVGIPRPTSSYMTDCIGIPTTREM